MRITDKLLLATRLPTDGPPGPVDLDPQRMTDLGVWKGICGPRSYEWCDAHCDEKKCGYYREAKRRGIDLTAISERQAAMDTRREKRAAKALQQQKAAEKPAKPARPPKPKKPKKPLRFAQPDKEW